MDKKRIKKLLKENVSGIREKFNLPVPKDIEIINKTFKQDGFELYIVGGSVRDALVNKEPKDWVFY